MPFCPNCRYEYLPEVSKCPDCNTDLVQELPDIPVDFENIKWVALTPLSGVVYARMVSEVLDQRGIPNYIQSLFGSGGLGQVMTAGTVGAQAKIYVPAEKQQEAQTIQDEMFKDA